MKFKFTSICLVCVSVLCGGEEHSHHHPAEHHHEDHHLAHGGLNHTHHVHDHDHQLVHDDHEHPHHKVPIPDTDLPLAARDYRVWMAATGSLLVISVCGVLGLMVVPLMQLALYTHLTQFLIALAVGTLTGDALLHLLPHAFLSAMEQGHGDHGHDDHHHDHSQHNKLVWLGFVGAASMIGFFVFEKLINLVGEMRRKHHNDRKLKIVRKGHRVSDRSIGEVCKNKYSSYCASELEGLGGVQEEHGGEESTSTSTTNVEAGGSREDCSEDRDTVIISQHEVVHRGHTHLHSHAHSAPSSISSVAIMVICGDGIHNLADGLAIGAAFADGYMSGLSTSLAILCHELPHEIGDFAMLLKAGMTTQQAVFYNLLSCVLAFIGMVAGLLLGTVHHFSAWMLAATAGIFLYVALVDMLPELTSAHSHPSSVDEKQDKKVLHWVSLLLQVTGMVSGVLIMLAIALYEHDLKEIFE